MNSEIGTKATMNAKQTTKILKNTFNSGKS